MKTFKCKDGATRVFTQKKIGLDINEMAHLLVSYHLYSESFEDDLKSYTSKKAVLNTVWDEIFAHGMEVAIGYRVGDNLSYDDADRYLGIAKKQIQKLWKEWKDLV